jgi:hypothetical protein
MVFLALKAGDVQGGLLFFGFALLLGLVAYAILRRWDATCAAGGDAECAEPPAPVRFVPHRFLMGAVLLTALIVLALILIPYALR